MAGSAIAGSEAAGATKDASNAAIAQQQSALQQQSTLSQPYRDLGQSAIPQLQSLLGIGTPGKNGQPTTQSQLDQLSSTPGYQFAQQQGQQNTLNAASAQGMSLSGNTLEGLSKFNQGLASETYQQDVQDLQSTVGVGQAAAAGQAANVGAAASNIGNTLVNQGNTLAGIDANVAAGISKSVGNASNQYLTNQTLQGLGGGYSQSLTDTMAQTNISDINNQFGSIAPITPTG